MTVALHRFDNPAMFRERALPFLVAREAMHNLLLGASAMLVDQPSHDGLPPYLATVERAGRVVAAVVRTPPRNLILSLADDEAALDRLVEDVAVSAPDCPGVIGPVPAARQFSERWHATTGQPYRVAVAERIYQLDQVTPVMGVPGAWRLAVPADRRVVREWLIAFYVEAVPGMTADYAIARLERSLDARLAGDRGAFCLWEDGGQSVSLAGYSGPTPNGMRVGPVYTPSAFRRRGYASALTAAVSAHLLNTGRRWCFLFTDLANPTSNHIYQAIGYRPVGDVDEIIFDG